MLFIADYAKSFVLKEFEEKLGVFHAGVWDCALIVSGTMGWGKPLRWELGEYPVKNPQPLDGVVLVA